MAGEWTNGFRGFVGFFNPGMQGIRRVGEVMHQVRIGNRRAQTMVATRVVLHALMYLATNALLGKDDKGQDELDKLTASKTYRSLMFPSPVDGKMIAIPRPLDTGPIDGIGIAVARYLAGHATAADAFSEWAREGLQRLSPMEVKEYTGILRNMYMPFTGAAKPLFEISANETGLGVPIASDAKQKNVIPALNGRDATAQWYKDAAAALHQVPGLHRGTDNFSPEDLKHLMTQYGAYLGRGVDALANYADENQPKQQGLSKLVPFVGRFTEDKPTTRPRFYPMYEDARQAASEFNSISDAGAKATARANAPQQAEIADLYDKTKKALSTLSRSNKASGLPAKERQETATAERTRIQDEFIQRFREINK
jgi:hypothetical protein